MPAPRINAAHRADHFRGKQDVLGRDHLGQHVDAVLMIDTGIEEDIAKNPLIQVAKPHILRHAPEPAPVIGHRPAPMRDDEFDLRKIGEDIGHHEMHESGGVSAEIERAGGVHCRMAGPADMNHRRHIQIAHGLVERIPVFVAKRQILPVAARRVRVQVAADEAHFLYTAAQFGDACLDRCLRALWQLANRHEILWKDVADTADQVVAMFGPCLGGAGVADMVTHPAGARREHGDIGAALLLDTKLVGLDAFTDLVITDHHHAFAADMGRIGGNRILLCVAPGGNAWRRGGVMTVAINDHGGVSGVAVS